MCFIVFMFKRFEVFCGGLVVCKGVWWNIDREFCVVEYLSVYLYGDCIYVSFFYVMGVE